MHLLSCHHACLTYGTVQIWPLHCKYDSHSHYPGQTYRSNLFVHISQKGTISNKYLIYYCQICATKKNVPKIPYICQICHLIHLQISDNYVSKYTSYKLNAINNGTTSTGILNFTLLTYALEQICLPHCTCTSHCTNNIVYM